MDVLTALKTLEAKLSTVREQGGSVGLVPTMGALHKGHLSLVQRALQENEAVVVSIFINPTQFNDPTDLSQYPQTLEADVKLLKSVSDQLLVFAPTVAEMYPEGAYTKNYDFKGLDALWEGADRPGHFKGVGTVVEKLFELVCPQKAYFGEKDFQQLAIIRALVSNKSLDISIVGCPIVRESNGLAMSSRNERLQPEQREAAGLIYKSLLWAVKNVRDKKLPEIVLEAKKQIETLENTSVFYFEFINATTLAPIKTITDYNNTRIITAVNFHGLRLLDNISLDPPENC